MTTETGFPDLTSANARDPQQARQVINRINRGKLNCIGMMTLSANVGTTTVLDPRVGPYSVVLLMPATANAAAALATTYVSDRSNKTSFTVSHSNNAQTDRSYGYALFG
jgi:hypothetical protein